jgi:hypothetical protein
MESQPTLERTDKMSKCRGKGCEAEAVTEVDYRQLPSGQWKKLPVCTEHLKLIIDHCTTVKDQRP